MHDLVIALACGGKFAQVGDQGAEGDVALAFRCKSLAKALRAPDSENAEQQTIEIKYQINSDARIQNGRNLQIAIYTRENTSSRTTQ